MLPLPGDSPLHTVAAQSPALVIFLRSFGCTFCREAMDDVSKLQQEIRRIGAAIVFVHGATAAEAAPWFSKYGLDGVTTISDPDRAHYQAFGLGRTDATAMIDPRVWLRGAASAAAHGFGSQTMEMMRQLPGVFVVQAGEVLAEYRHRSPADRPDYVALLQSATRNPQSTM
jgi:peroxiredoxin